MNPTLILAAITAAQELITFILKARTEAVRTGEWTPEEEAQFDALLQTKFNEPHWKPDPQ